MRWVMPSTSGNSFSSGCIWGSARRRRSARAHAIAGGCAQLVCTRLYASGSPPVGAPEPRPLAGIVAVLVDVPVGAAGVPHRTRQRRPQLAIERLGRLPGDLDPPRVGPLELTERSDHVVDPGLDR